MDIQEILNLPAAGLRQRSRVQFELFPNAPAMLDRFARMMADELRQNNALGLPTRWILPVGPVAQYRTLVKICNRERISWRSVHAFQMDEFLDWQGRPLAHDHPLSFAGYLHRALYSRLEEDLRPDPPNIHAPNPFSPDAISEAIAAAGGVDTCFGGVGYHGHIAFNEPPLSRWHKVSVDQLRNSLTRVLTLGADSVVVQSIHSSGGSADLIPPMAVTLGMRDILASRKIRLFLAAGERHRAVFRITLLADPCVEYPSTLVQGHADCVVHTEEATARPIRPSLDWGMPYEEE